MFQNEITDKLQYFAQQGMDREKEVKAARKKRRNERTMAHLGHNSEKSKQLKLF